MCCLSINYSVVSQAATGEHIEDFAEMVGLECLFIDQETRLRGFRQEVR